MVNWCMQCSKVRRARPGHGVNSKVLGTWSTVACLLGKLSTGVGTGAFPLTGPERRGAKGAHQNFQWDQLMPATGHLGKA